MTGQPNPLVPRLIQPRLICGDRAVSVQEGLCA